MAKLSEYQSQGVTLTPSCDEDVKEEASCEYFLSFGKLHRINDWLQVYPIKQTLGRRKKKSVLT